MKLIICLVAFFSHSALGYIVAECNLAGFYMELGCIGAPSANENATCPETFTCPNLHPDPTMCYYRGKAYADKETIPQNLIRNQCSQVCVCSVQEVPQFDCAAVDCVEVYDSDKERDCINTYELDSCCSTGSVCGKDAIAKLDTCTVDGKTYKEGEVFEPAKTRKSCICTPEWKGIYDDPATCRDINCGIEIHYQDKIVNNCAPVFSSNLKSCPITFQCPSTTSKVIRSSPRSVTANCTFGNMTVNVGDEIAVEEKCTKCTCEVPPFVSCMRESPCN